MEGRFSNSRDELLKTGKAWLERFVPGFPILTSKLQRAWNAYQTGIDRMAPGKLFQIILLKTCVSRLFFMTSSGYFGIGPSSIQNGDLIAIAFGSSMPIIIRPSELNTGKYILIGPCYVHGIMYGEIMKELESNSISTFTLV